MQLQPMYTGEYLQAYIASKFPSFMLSFEMHHHAKFGGEDFLTDCTTKHFYRCRKNNFKSVTVYKFNYFKKIKIIDEENKERVLLSRNSTRALTSIE